MTAHLYFALPVAAIALGPASRRWAGSLPQFVGAYAGDTLWAVAAYWGLALARPETARVRRSLVAFGIAVAVEVSQLFHRPGSMRSGKHGSAAGPSDSGSSGAISPAMPSASRSRWPSISWWSSSGPVTQRGYGGLPNEEFRPNVGLQPSRMSEALRSTICGVEPARKEVRDMTSRAATELGR